MKSLRQGIEAQKSTLTLMLATLNAAGRLARRMYVLCVLTLEISRLTCARSFKSRWKLRIRKRMNSKDNLASTIAPVEEIINRPKG